MPFSLTKISRGATLLTLCSALTLTTALRAHAQTETVLHSFAGRPDGATPSSVLILDTKGNLYGVTFSGGAYSKNGTVFKMTPSGTETILHRFHPQRNEDGGGPTGLVLDKNGNLYGTTADGGANGRGTVFKLTPSKTETVLYSFGANGTDGSTPCYGVALDTQGNLYGMTFYGGAYGGGTAFKVTPSGTETILHSFNTNGTDGYFPFASPILDKKGNLYGTTYYGGAYCSPYGCGTVFELTPSGTETILYSFGADGVDGQYPEAGLVFDEEGNLYGTTRYGGAYGNGTVFELMPSGTETILWSFGNGTDGANPVADLIFDGTGNLYGTTPYGGAYGNNGTVFELMPSGTETILHSFNSNGTDGYVPWDGLVMDTKGNLYGTTWYGGAYNYGTVYKVTR